MVQQIAKKNYMSMYWLDKERDEVSEFAVYKGDELVYVGTAKECADHLGIKVSSFFSYMTPSRMRQIGEKRKGKRSRMEIVRLDDEEDDE